MGEELPIERCYKIILSCIDALEKGTMSANGTVSKLDVPEWNKLFGEKETTLSALTKLVAMQKTVLELMQRAQEHKHEAMPAKMTAEDWKLLELCVKRRKRKQMSESEVRH